MSLTMPKQLVLDRAAIKAVAPPIAEIVEIVEETYRMDAAGKVEAPTKIGVHPDHSNSFLHAMPAWVSAGKALGVKWISYYPGNTARGLPSSSGLIVLNDPENGLPVAIMEGMWITLVRTAACGAVATKYCVRGEPTRLGLIGCGGLGSSTVRVFSSVFPSIKEIRVASRTKASRHQFCDEMSGMNSCTLRPVDRVEDAVRDMDIVVSAVPKSSERPLQGTWWSPGTVAVPLDVLTAWDDEAFTQLDRLVTDNYERLQGIIRQQRPRLVLPENWDSFGDVVTGRSLGRKNAQERIMVIPTGVASVDMTLAWEIYRRARRAGLGTEIDLLS